MQWITQRITAKEFIPDFKDSRLKETGQVLNGMIFLQQRVEPYANCYICSYHEAQIPKSQKVICAINLQQ